MKRVILCMLVVVVLLSCVACGGMTHSCTSVCQTCQKCLNAECDKAACADQCAGHREEAFTFQVGDYITESDVSIDIGKVVLDIGPGIYVRGDASERAKDVVAAIEAVSGLDFDGYGYARESYPDGKVHVNISRDALYVGEDWYTGSVHSEVGNAYASVTKHVFMSPADLPIFRNYTLIHELSHVLMFRQQGWNHSQLLDEGFAEYTTYRVLQELPKNDPTYMVDMGHPSMIIFNMAMSAGTTELNDDKLYEYPVEHWFDNTFEYAFNRNYAIGFRFMAYLDAVYGDYSGWMLTYNELYPYDRTIDSDMSTTEQQIAVLKATYGEDVLDGFYPWLMENAALFTYDRQEKYDVSGAESINWYPEFHAVGSRVYYFNLEYRDLYINLETAKTYLSEYKGCDISNIKLTASQEVSVNLYRADGSYTSILLTEPVSLEGISYIKLVGEGFLENLEIVDFVVDPQ